MGQESGRVSIVGAGPGDPELMTLKADRLLREADVVVFDRLVSASILERIPAGTARVFAGKMARNHMMPQPEINALLVSLAEGGRHVVRLKGGDPFLFGRGGEEAEYLARRGIAFEIVPGVTSASGCSAYAGIPLTHRGLSHSVRFITGHAQDDGPLGLDWAGLADARTTLVIYMGRTNIHRIARGLIEHGLAAETPAAAVVRGTHPDQQQVVTTLAALPAAVDRLDLAAPTLIVVGKVVALSRQLSWFRPTQAQAQRKAQAGSQAGADAEAEADAGVAASRATRGDRPGP
jgi:uroporphyrin-III C-methyltransferase/precorrin-2 dehydrogenase/sirohydrochlorin ferrochelatase/uroporphyrin-III C-methyltransferase